MKQWAKRALAFARRVWGRLCLAGIAALLLGSTVYYAWDAIAVGASYAAVAYEKAYRAGASQARDAFYQMGFQAGRKFAHRANFGMIHLGDLPREEALPVLHVQDVIYLQGADDETLWLQVGGKGVFTVDLWAGEIIADHYRKRVIVRVPAPQLCDFSQDNSATLQLYLGEDGAAEFAKLDDTDARIAPLVTQGLAQLQHQLAYARPDLQLAARRAAEHLLCQAVRQHNATMADLVVEVEFLP